MTQNGQGTVEIDNISLAGYRSTKSGMKIVSGSRTVVARSGRVALGLGLLCFLFATSKVSAQDQDEFDSYRARIEGYWVYSTPSGSFRGENDPTRIDLQKDLRFNTYSTFVGKLDWKFTHKNHFYVEGVAYNSSRQVILDRTIVFRGQTFEVGTTVRGSLDSPVYVFGYQYDIIRRRRGHLGIGVQANVFDTHAAIGGAAQVVNGVQQSAIHASGSLVAPIPVAGPQFRVYLTDSPRLFVEGNVYGMYFFGYGNFVSTQGVVGLTVNKHFAAKGGYQLGSRLEILASTGSNRIGIGLNQQGPVAGIEFSF